MENFKKLQDKVSLLPLHSGVYIMKNSEGEVIYVGKAKKLKNRVKSYFDNSQKTVKTYALVSNIEDFEYILTNSELDAFSLESNLIKKYKPKYNILLKDDKSFPYIKINLKERYPRVTIVRRPQRDGSLLFGPFVTGIRISEIMSLIKWAYPLRWCNTNFDDGKRRARPCLHGEIGTCIAPCVSQNEEEYNNVIRKVIDFLNGDNRDIKIRLRTRMDDFASKMQFEEALEIRNLLEAIEKMDNELITNLTKDSSIDVFALASTEELTVINVMKIRAGKNEGQFNFLFDEVVGTPSEMIQEFISSYYSESQDLPKEILLEDYMEDDCALIEEFIFSKFDGKRVKAYIPKKSTKKHLIDNAKENAMEYVQNSLRTYERHKKLTSDALKELAEIVGVKSINRIEGYDISNISGTNNVASMVVFVDGEPTKKEYRKFKIKTVEGANDFACLEEALYRRLTSLKEKQTNLDIKPDLILIDGGLGQLHSVNKVIQSVGFDIPVISLAKQDEEIFATNSSIPIKLPKDNFALRLLQRVRDESHRFAVMYHRSLRKQSMSSFLLNIKGVGEKTSQSIWKHFKTIENIMNAKPEDFKEIPGISDKMAIEIYTALSKEK